MKIVDLKNVRIKITITSCIWGLASCFTTNSRIGNTETVMCTEVDAEQETECEQYQTEKSSYGSIPIEEAYTKAKQLEKK